MSAARRRRQLQHAVPHRAGAVAGCALRRLRQAAGVRLCAHRHAGRRVSDGSQPPGQCSARPMDQQQLMSFTAAACSNDETSVSYAAADISQSSRVQEGRDKRLACKQTTEGSLAGCLSVSLLFGCSRRVRCACWSGRRRRTRCRTSSPTTWAMVRLLSSRRV